MSNLSSVNLLQGTDSNFGFSTGSTEPIEAMPFGMAHWTLQTDSFWGWQFRPRSPVLQGIRLTHQPSPWMGDYGAFLITPQTGERRLKIDQRGCAWNVGDAQLCPHQMAVALPSTGMKWEAAPTERGAVFRFRFPEGQLSRLLVQGVEGETHFELRADGRTVVGWTRGNNGGVPQNFASYMVIELSHPVLSWATFVNDALGAEGQPGTAKALGLSLELGRTKAVTLRVGTSFVSVEQAQFNLHREIGDASWESIARRAERVWEHALGQIQVSGEDEKSFKTFYSCFYRTKLFPRKWYEIDSKGTTMHFSPYDGAVHAGPLYADTGFWDTYRTQHPLMTLLEPSRQAEMLQGFVSAYRDSGWMPQWPSPGHRVSMPGTHLDAVIADAVAKGIHDFDIDAALEGMLQHADHANRGGPFGGGRNDIENYLKLGYCLGSGAVAQTLDYAYDDWAISEVAAFLGKRDVSTRMLRRAGNWRHLYDPSVGFMRAKDKNGAWIEPFDPLAWGGPYVEGGPWQSSWATPHDPAGLMAAMGGEVAMAEKIDLMLNTPPDFHVGSYGTVIHEMEEMHCAHFGQYAQSNQPVHHVLYLYLATGRPCRCQAEVRRVMKEMYSPDVFPGDEDNGEMAAWYVLSALGIYPHCPGRPEWAIGSPQFRKAELHLPNGRSLVIDAPENRSENVYVDSISRSGHLWEKSVISHTELLAGGELHFHMSDQPNKRITPTRNRPTSMSAYV